MKISTAISSLFPTAKRTGTAQTQAEADETVKLDLADNNTYDVDATKNAATVAISHNDIVVTNTDNVTSQGVGADLTVSGNNVSRVLEFSGVVVLAT